METLYESDEINPSQIEIDGQSIDLIQYTKNKRSKVERMFYIPAQRVLSLREGQTRPFTDYRAGDPFVLREFSEKIHTLVQSEFASTTQLFPQDRRLKSEFRDLVNQNIFRDFFLKIDTKRFQKRIVLGHNNTQLPYLVWSAGQREFVPLLLGLYWLMPAGKTNRKGDIRWIVIEEPEMGLHPDAISTTMALILGLLWRGYRVCVSTHSPQVLDVVWALQILQAHRGTNKDVLNIFNLKSTVNTKKIADTALKKMFRVYFFKRDGHVQDISKLDPGSDDRNESGWGGLTGFSGNVADIVATAINRSNAA
jgi:hypothetical protein